MQMALVCVRTERLQASRLPSDHDKPCAHTHTLTYRGSRQKILQSLLKYLCAVVRLQIILLLTGGNLLDDLGDKTC